MTTRINEQQFSNMFSDGIDPAKMSYATGKAWEAKYDANQDGMIKGDELKAVYADLDALDETTGGIVLGDGNTRDDRVFARLTEAAVDPGQVRILTQARTFIEDPSKSAEFKHDGTCALKNPDASGTYDHKWKCNAFVGEVMFAAGFEYPTYNDNKRYLHPLHLPGAKEHFDNVGTLDKAQPGDLIMVDYGDGRIGHVEVITNVTTTNGKTTFTSMGARFNGIKEDSYVSDTMKNAKQVGDHYEAVIKGHTYKFYVLHPKKPLTVQSPGVGGPTQVRP